MGKRFSIIFLAILIFATILNAQKIRVEVQASVNYPHIPTYTRSIYPNQWFPIADGSGVVTVDNSTRVRETYQNNLGGKLGLNVTFDLVKNFYLKTGFGLNFISFQRQFNYINLATPHVGGFSSWTIVTPHPQSPDIGKTYILFAEIPVTAGYRFFKEKLSVNLGCMVSILTYSEQYIIDPFYYYYSIYERTIRDKTGTGLTNLSFSVNGEIAYQIWKKFSIFTRYSYQLSSIYDKRYRYVGTPRYNLFELGAGYRIY